MLKSVLPLLLTLLLPSASLAGPPPQVTIEARLDDLEDELGEILALYTAGSFDESEAATALFDRTAASLTYLAAGLTADLANPGAKRSVSEGALDAASGTYSEFAIGADELLREALAELDDTRVAVRVQKRFGPFLEHGPRLAGEPDDRILVPTGWLAAAAWNGPQGRALIGAGYGVEAGGPNGKLRLVGPDGREETIDLPYETLAATPLTATAFTLDPAPGNWRLELRYGDDANPSDIVQITAP